MVLRLEGLNDEEINELFHCHLRNLHIELSLMYCDFWHLVFQEIHPDL